MKNRQIKDFLFQLISLILAIIVVHSVYSAVIRPQAAADLRENQEMLAADSKAEERRSLSIILKDYEQESCIILLLWALAILFYKGSQTLNQRRLLSEDFLLLPEGGRIIPEDSRDLTRHLESLPISQKESLVPNALLIALRRFDSGRSIQDVSEAAQSVCQQESDRLESELSIIRYIAWAIPSIGFIGTVRGISQALGKAHLALEGDITGVTQNLGVAFNSTFVALLISILLMFIIHQIQLMQERYVLDTETYCEERLIRHLYTR